MANRRIFDLVFRTRGLDTAKNQTDQLDSSFNNLASTAKTVAVSFVSLQTGLKAVEMAKLAAQTETVRKSFNNLAAEPDKMLQSMKKATAGTISEMELMQKFNEAALLGLPLERFDEMLEIARGAAQATGQSMDFMLQSVVVALGRQSKLMLDNLGILIDTESANEKYATSLNKTVKELTDQEKKQAFVNEALSKGQINLEKMGGITESSVDVFASFNASLEDLQVTIGEELLPVVIPIVESLKDLIENLDVEKVKAYGQGLAIVTGGFIAYKTATMGAVSATRLFRGALIKSGIGALVVGLGEAIHAYSEYKEESEDSTDADEDFVEVQQKVVEVQQKRIESQEKVVEANNKMLETVQQLTQGDQTELAYQESLKGSYAEFIEQQFITLENKEKEDRFIERFTKAYPQQAKALGILTSSQKQQAAALKDNIQLAGAFASALSNAFDPNQSGAEAFQGFIINVITALQGVVLASKAVSEALTTTFIPGLGIGGAIAALVALEAAKAGVRSIRFAQYGMDEMVSQPTLIMAGEAGPERVQVTPTTRPSSQNGGGGITLNFNGPVTNKEFIRDTVIPEIQRVQNLGLA
jgi:hypothetical protein